MQIARNIQVVRDRISDAARRANRDPETVSLMAVSKNFPASLIFEAYDSGIRLFGENRVQEFAQKADILCELRDIRWHMIGHLQTNKASRAIELFNAVDSVDSFRLASKLNAEAGKVGKKLPVLIEVNVGGELSKTGVATNSPQLEQLLQSAPTFRNLDFRGLMTIPPFYEDPQQARPFFRKLRELRDQIEQRQIASVSTEILSMGMSHDFEIAIEEGSTCVRVGTAIFGSR